MSLNKSNTIAYCRYSKNEKGNTYTIEQQKEAVEKCALENNYKIQEIFVDKSVAGRKFNRKGFRKMLDYIDSNPRSIQVLIVSDVSRIFVKQNSFYWSFKRLLENSKIELISLFRDMPRYTQKPPEQQL